MTIPIFFVNELFETIQGEAHWTGTPAVFVRLQGCDVGCSWCDTKHTWEIPLMSLDKKSSNEVSANLMLNKNEDSPNYARLSQPELIKQIQSFRAKHVVITGGEPALYDLTSLTECLIALDFNVQLETSGTYPIRVSPAVWVTLSPKLNMAGRKEVRLDALARANEIKLPVGKLRDYELFCDWLKDKILPDGDVWLQPLSQNPTATQLCCDIALANGHRVSVQVHKYLGIR